MFDSSFRTRERDALSTTLILDDAKPLFLKVSESGRHVPSAFEGGALGGSHLHSARPGWEPDLLRRRRDIGRLSTDDARVAVAGRMRHGCGDGTGQMRDC